VELHYSPIYPLFYCFLHTKSEKSKMTKSRKEIKRIK